MEDGFLHWCWSDFDLASCTSCYEVDKGLCCVVEDFLDDWIGKVLVCFRGVDGLRQFP